MPKTAALGWLALVCLSAALPAADLLVEKISEGAQARLGGWSVAHNDNGLPTTLAPDPFAPEAGGSPLSPGHSGRIHGHLGPNRAPYSWAQLSLKLAPDGAPMDLSGYKSLRFWVKGDGKRHVVKLIAVVADFDQPRFSSPPAPNGMSWPCRWTPSPRPAGARPWPRAPPTSRP